MKSDEAKAGYPGGFREGQDLPWLRKLFDVPGVDQAYTLKGMVELDRRADPTPTVRLRVTTPDNLASIARKIHIEPVDLWSAENSSFEVLLDGRSFRPGFSRSEFATTGGRFFRESWPRNFTIPAGKELEIRWVSQTNLGNPVWYYYIEGFVAIEALK
jgi:hypothetical protein